jgi:uncharacterized SAM-dependent methyltransferase
LVSINNQFGDGDAANSLVVADGRAVTGDSSRQMHSQGPTSDEEVRVRPQKRRLSNNSMSMQVDEHTDVSELAAFKKDAIATFSRSDGGIMNRWTYLGGGARKWAAYQASGKPYIADEDANLIATRGADLLAERFSRAKNLVDYGSGDPKAVKGKAMQVFKRIADRGGLYVPIDNSHALLQDAAAAARDEIGEYDRVLPIHGDFYKDIDFSAKDGIALPEGNTLAVLFGSTISNINMMTYDYQPQFPKKALIDNIRKLAAIMQKQRGEHGMAISWDSNPDLDHALQAYDQEDWKEMITGWVQHVDEKLKPASPVSSRAFNPNKWHYEGVTNPHNFAVQQCVVAEKMQEFRLNGKLLTVPKNDKLVVTNNVKYPVHYMREAVREAGFEPHAYGDRNYILADEGRLAIVTFDVPGADR